MDGSLTCKHFSHNVPLSARFWRGRAKRVNRRTEILIEIDEVTLISWQSGSRRQWCPHCTAEVTTVTPQQASAIAQVSVRTINQWVESGRVHFVETAGGLLFVCLESLSDLGNRRI